MVLCHTWLNLVYAIKILKFKNISLRLLLSCHLCVSEFDCSKVQDPSIDRFYPHNDECNKFYRYKNTIYVFIVTNMKLHTIMYTNLNLIMNHDQVHSISPCTAVIGVQKG